MENLEVETTLDTRHRTKTKNTTQVSYKDEQHDLTKQTGLNPGAHERYAVPVSLFSSLI